MDTRYLEPFLFADGMRRADTATIERYQIPADLLMETAGREAARVIATRHGPLAEKHLVVVAGKGNNGGDGFVVARAIFEACRHVTVVHVQDRESGSAEAIANLERLERMAREADNLTLLPAGELPPPAPPPDLIVDAVLGVGTSGPIREPASKLVAWIRDQACPVIALDVPSGLDSDSGRTTEGAVIADLTVSFGALKPGTFTMDGPDHSGEVQVVDIGLAVQAVRSEIETGHGGWRLTDAFARATLPARKHGAHKFSAGKVVCICGSLAFPGAAVLSARAASAAGAGYVQVVLPESARHLTQAHLIEQMTLGMPATAEGTLSMDALEDVLDLISDADSVVLGCGLGKDPETATLVRQIVRRSEVPMVIDADGLNALVGHTGLLQSSRPERFVLTPHLGEFQRLVDREDVADPFTAVSDAAREWGVTVLLKGSPTLVSENGNRLFAAASAPPALATAGTGDVLSGMTAGLMAQGLAPVAAALCALHVGSRCAEAFSRDHHAPSMVASDLFDLAPRMLATLNLYPRKER
ncbi:NAD(P)H-hydrate dehydratase [soil metagenome]